MANQLKLGTQKTNISQGYIAYYPCLQANTDTTLVDRSGQGRTGSVGTLTTGEVWANANWATTLASANKHLSISAADFLSGWTFSPSDRQSLFFAFRTKMTLPGSTLALVGNVGATPGFKGQVTTGGKMSWNYYDGTTTVSGTQGSGSISGATEYSIAMFIDGINMQAMWWQDGVRQLSTWTNLATLTATVSGNAGPFLFGASLAGDTGIAAQFRGIHLIKAPQSYGAFAYYDELALRLHRAPFTPISADEWLY